MSSTSRLNLRIPASTRSALEHAARLAGYASACQLARCVLVQFVSHSEIMSRKRAELTDWMDDMAEDHLDPTNRKRINERL